MQAVDSLTMDDWTTAMLSPERVIARKLAPVLDRFAVEKADLANCQPVFDDTEGEALANRLWSEITAAVRAVHKAEDELRACPNLIVRPTGCHAAIFPEPAHA